MSELLIILRDFGSIALLAIGIDAIIIAIMGVLWVIGIYLLHTPNNRK